MEDKSDMLLNSVSSFDDMNGHDFERYCADLLRFNGFSNIQVTQGSGDNGVDILAKKSGVSYAIQCKRYSGKVSNKAVQEVYSGAAFYGTDRAAIMTNSYFTDQAIIAANRLNVELWDRDKLKSFEGNSDGGGAFVAGCLVVIGILLGLILFWIFK